jgi:O-antigen ligase
MGDALAAAGLLLAALAASGAMLWAPTPRRSSAMLIALALIPTLILADQWHSVEITYLRHHPDRLAALATGTMLMVAAMTVLFRRRPVLLPLALIAAIPFRIPIHAGGHEANLLIPLYLVIGSGVLAVAWEHWKEHQERRSAGGAAGEAPPRADRGSRGGVSSAVTGPAAGGLTLLPKVLAAVIVLYALQSIYSEDFSQALQNTAFFYVPFALAFTLLCGCRWDRRLLVWSLCVIAAEALAFVLFGFWEYGARHLIWNDEVIQSNDFHTYFRINSVFWDPNVYGRYLALTILAIAAALLWVRSSRLVLWLGALVAVLWLGLITTFSQSSFAALLAGLAVLAALRWSLRWTVLTSLGAVLAAAIFVLAAGGSLKIDLSTQHKLNKDTSGRANLVSEGVALFGDRPIWGYGSGSFSTAYRKHRSGGGGRLSVSHTEPVTVAAEQGLIGLAAYLTLLIAAFTTLLRGMKSGMQGLRSPPSAGGAGRDDRAAPSAGGAGGGDPDRAAGRRPRTGGVLAGDRTRGQEVVLSASRAAVLACFVALLAHTMGYAGFLEDPLTWVLLAIGGSLAVAPQFAAESAETRRRSEAAPPAPARAPA